jgi:hypothetical protein
VWYGSNQPHEAAYPSFIKINDGEWWAAYSATLFPINGEEIGVGIIKIADPMKVPFEVLHRSIIRPTFHMWSPVLVRGGDKLYLYSTDLSKPPGVIRQWVQASQTIGPAYGVTVTGYPQGGVDITDVAIGSDGKWYALVNVNWQVGKVSLYQSNDGLAFTYIKSYTRPGEMVFDGGFTRWPDSRLVEPMLIFGNSVPVGTTDATLFNKWRLVWWAEAGAKIPQPLIPLGPRPVR